MSTEVQLTYLIHYLWLLCLLFLFAVHSSSSPVMLHQQLCKKRLASVTRRIMFIKLFSSLSIIQSKINQYSLIEFRSINKISSYTNQTIKMLDYCASSIPSLPFFKPIIQLTNFLIQPFQIIIYSYSMSNFPKQIQLKDMAHLLNPPLHTEDHTPDAFCAASEETLADPNQKVSRPSIKGPFRPIRTGNIKGSIFALLGCALGTGCLNLPFRVNQLGIVPFMLEITMVGLLAYFGMYMMERIIIKYKVASYAEMVERAFGPTVMHVAQTMLVMLPWGFAICIQVIFAKLTVQVMYDVFGLPVYSNRDEEIYSPLGSLMRIIVSIGIILFNIKHFSLTDLTVMLQSLGKFSVTGVLICMSFIIITAVSGFTKKVRGESLDYESIFTMNYEHVRVFRELTPQYLAVLPQAMCGVFYVFLNHQFVFPLVSNLKKPTKKRVDRIFVYSHLQMYAIDVTIALLGYLLLAQHIDQVPISSLVISNIPTWPLLVGKIFLVSALFFSLPIQIFAAREYLYEALDLERNDSNMKKLNVGFIGSSFIIGLFFEGVSMYFGLIGGTVGVMMAGIIPTACYYKLIALNDLDKAMMAFVAVISTICFYGAIMSVLSPA